MMKKILNKSAKAEYEILDKYQAGIALYGHEAKSIRIGKASLKGSFVKVSKGEAYLHNLHIHGYKYARLEDYEPTRARKLLLKKKEILKLEHYDKRKGVTLVPMAIYSSKGRFKVEVGVGRGKKEFEKRADIKKRDQNREMRRQFKSSQLG